jgi:uncharacterized protein YjiS (DUF1127 family)
MTTQTITLYHAARAHRSAAIAELFGTALQSVKNALARALAAYRRRRNERATYVALSNLDAWTLRDLGLHRSELLSVAAEVSGEAHATRARLMTRRRRLIDRTYSHGTPCREP